MTLTQLETRVIDWQCWQQFRRRGFTTDGLFGQNRLRRFGTAERMCGAILVDIGSNSGSRQSYRCWRAAVRWSVVQTENPLS